MKYLLDSHALWWWVTNSSKLPERLKQIFIADPRSVYVSIISLYELGLKQNRGKLPGHPLELREAVKADGFLELALTANHMVLASQFDWRHGDPWDRMLAAQAQAEGCALVSIDKAFDEIALERIW